MSLSNAKALTENDIRAVAISNGFGIFLAAMQITVDHTSPNSQLLNLTHLSISTTALSAKVLGGMSLEDALITTIFHEIGHKTVLSNSAQYGFDPMIGQSMLSNGIANNSLAHFKEGLAYTEASSYLAQFFVKTNFDLDTPILNQRREDITAHIQAIANDLFVGTYKDDKVAYTRAILDRLASDFKLSTPNAEVQKTLNNYVRGKLKGAPEFASPTEVWAMSAAYDTSQLPSLEELANDIASLQELEILEPCLSYRVFVDGVPVDSGSWFCKREPSTHGSIQIGDDPVDRLTIFVNGELWMDEYCDLTNTPIWALGAQAVWAVSCLGERMTGNWLDFPAPPPWFWGNAWSNSVESPLAVEMNSNAQRLVEYMSGFSPPGSTVSTGPVSEMSTDVWKFGVI